MKSGAPNELEQIARHARYHARVQCAVEAEDLASYLALPDGKADRKGRAALRRIARVFRHYAKEEMKEPWTADLAEQFNRMTEEELLRALEGMAPPKEEHGATP